jgi:SNF2 family DNA or RNA helicase
MAETQFIINKRKVPVKIEPDDDKLILSFPYNPGLIKEVKTAFNGARWNPAIKKWSIHADEHNWFQIRFLSGLNPYAPYDSPLPKFEPIRDYGVIPYDHQLEMAAHEYHRHYCLIACEMGTGKTLATIMALEKAGVTDVIWVGPKSALVSVELEFEKWRSHIKPRFVTYSSLKKMLESWDGKAPQAVVFDESQKIKNAKSQRSEAAAYLATSIREEHKDNGFVILLTGTPAPKSPLDWYHQCEVARPGFLKEGNIYKFRDRLAILTEGQNATGGVYPQLVTWKDDEKKCDKCGQAEDDFLHSDDFVMTGDGHPFIKSRNEVSFLYDRMKGLVIVKKKKDCLSLPDKQYRTIRLQPSLEVQRAADLILDTAPSAIKALTLLRELSDGFQYIEKIVGEETCPSCKGERTTKQLIYTGPEKTYDFLRELGIDCDLWIDPEDAIIDPVQHPEYYKEQLAACTYCKGVGTVQKYDRSYIELPCPKDEVLKNLLEDHEDVGRFVVYAGFSASIDRVVKIVTEASWNYIKMDGRGIKSSIGGTIKDLIDVFQNKQEMFEKVVFIGHPASASTGLTLTASPSTLYYSNDFDGENRSQSEDRIHRPGMDENRGATIYDIFHLATDEYVLDNLRKKRKLENISLGELHAQTRRF